MYDLSVLWLHLQIQPQIYCLASILSHGLFILDLDPGLVGLSLTSSIALTRLFQYCVRISAEVENLVNIYTMHL